MAVLVLAEHDNSVLKDATLHTISAARGLTDEVHVLVAGAGCRGVAEACAKIEGVSKVLLADHSLYEHPLAEAFGLLLEGLTSDYSALLAASTTPRQPAPATRT